MKMHRRAARRSFDCGAIPALAAALLLTAALPGDAQQRQRPSDSGSSGRSVGSSSGSSSGGSKGGSVSPSRPSSSSPSTPSTRNTGSPERPRTAQPAGPGGSSEPRRQPPHRIRRDGGGGHYHGGGYYGGYYYRPYSFYYWPWYTPYWYYGPGGGYYPYRDRGYVDRDTLGALDLDISPGRTEVYLDGQHIGIVDQFDGFPQYLWLEKGTYDLVFYREGYKTQARQISVYPGLVISVDGRMERGESVRPEDLGPKTHERRDARIRDEEERRERIEERSEWRDRVRGDRDRWREDRGDDDHDADMDDDDGRSASRGEDGWLRLDVEPADASVYVDGKFVGTGSEISELRSGLRLAPGRHKLAIVRPGHKAEETSFEVEAGESVELEIELDSYE